MSNLLEKAVNHSIWTSIGSIGTAIIGFFFAGVTIRWLGEAEAGFVIAVSTLVGVNATFSNLGLGAAATRLISKSHHDNDWQTLKIVSGICLIASLAFGGLGFCFFYLGTPLIIQWSQYEGNPEIGRWYCFLSGIGFFLSQISGYLNNLLFSLQRFDWQTKIKIGFGLANGICGITLLKAFPSILTVGIVMTSLSAIQVLFTSYVVIQVIGFFPLPRWNLKIFRDLWDFGRWVYLTQITSSLMIGLDKIFLTSLFGSASLPFYTLPQNIYINIHQILVSQANYLFPMLSSLGEDINLFAERIENRLRWFIGIISSVIFSSLIILSPGLLSVIVDSQFSEKASFQLLIFSLVGYIHSQAIIPFFFGLSKGDAKGNWLFHLISGFSMVLFLVILSSILGFKYSVIGNLGIIIGVLYLSKREKREMRLENFIIWFFKPLFSSLLIIFLSLLIYFFVYSNSLIYITNIMIFGLFLIGVCLLIPYIECRYLGGNDRIETLGRATAIILRKIGIPENFVVFLFRTVKK